EVRDAKRLGAAAVMVLGTAGARQLDDPLLFPFYAAICDGGLPLAIHVAWACPSLNNLYSHIYPSRAGPFHFPVLVGVTALISGGLSERIPKLRAVLHEAASMWAPSIIDSLNQRFQTQAKKFATSFPQTKPVQALPVMEYIKRGNLFFSAELEDSILPQVMDLVGQTQVVMGTDMPHGDRERFAARHLEERNDLSASAKAHILEHNPSRLYGLQASR